MEQRSRSVVRYSTDVPSSVKRKPPGADKRSDAARRRAVDAALPLFIEQGYERTSVRQVSDAANVSPQTIYNVFGSKADLFGAVMDVVVAGDHEPVPIADRPEVAALRTLEQPVALLRAATAVAVSILARLNPIYPTLRAAATSDPQVARLYERFTVQARYAQQRTYVARLDELGGLHADFSIDRAADVLWSVLSPDMFHLLVVLRGWSREAFETWAADLLVSSLIRTQQAEPETTRRHRSPRALE
jgi:AcrR family transcriptional regulator